MMRVGFFLTAFFLCTTFAAAQGANVLTGKVITPSGLQPNNPVRVKLTFNGRAIHETFTDLSGRFSFPGVGRGTYQLTAEGDGMTFETTSVYADVSAFGTAPQSFSQDIQLRPIKHKPIAQPGVVNAFNQVVPDSAREALDLGIKLGEEGKTEAAVENFRRAIQIFPDYFDAHLQLGNLFLKRELFTEAIAELDRAREIDPNDERAYQSFGLLLMKQKNYQVAVAVFGEAMRLNPSNPMNALMRATALIHQAATINEASSAVDRSSLLSQADAAISQATSLSGNKVRPDSLTLALFYEMKGDPERAANELDAYVQRTPQAKNSQAIQNEIKRLREKSRSTKTTP